MTVLIVRYFEEVSDSVGSTTLNLLGSETLDGVTETLLPGFAPGFKVFCNKKFSSSTTYNWFVARVGVVPAAPGTPTSFEVVLKEPYVASPVEYLNQTVRKSRTSVAKLLYQGSLVEVDYGFVQSIGREDGSLKTNKRYSDTIQKGEMHKRRLCIVVKVRGPTIQVVPITSEPPSTSDKTSFQIDSATLSNLARYGTSGKDSYAICNMIETVSIRRVLPPEAFYFVGGNRRQGRNVSYPAMLGKADGQRLRTALLHSIGVTDYADLKEDVATLQKRCADLAPFPAELAATQLYTAELEARLMGLERFRRLAAKWAGELGLDIEKEAAQLA
ncbi:type II toxin-antitoxin system PemK/MazF family toxin [Xanthomonas campestris]|uniref:type II toxin-antitoxin system PemK/MazF family toxin n=1 Tax=Xanthomonas campestris TaxID=339 RepID=UPI0008A233A0|nr:type II toxin-antitoxin system PemK/MazF family toxin [Xanthomonas campestris]MEB1153629.1 type II toxin-antitoxin system PemK/MazF family toxin [Xanthomonas campestris pv. campestris]MCC5098187.1 type II toxin-antitoxin system PemK/MazF family toxin [Xanthomonas campestris]MEA9583719.1 type II toxin-antitoxin system PemK/MazF family toxin [Xanthomonas campestris]MEA9593197.1 type II toxin-antitoxin system PemK/MazF family toxin [Xanthomonas campestris]MEA9623814.1 type II toxin-antitoxin s